MKYIALFLLFAGNVFSQNADWKESDEYKAFLEKMYAITDDDEWEQFMQSEEFLYYESLNQTEQAAIEEEQNNPTPPVEEETTGEEPVEETPNEETTEPTEQPEDPVSPPNDIIPSYGSACKADKDCGEDGELLCGSIYFERVQAQKVCVHYDDCYTRIKYTDYLYDIRCGVDGEILIIEGEDESEYIAGDASGVTLNEQGNTLPGPYDDGYTGDPEYKPFDGRFFVGKNAARYAPLYGYCFWNADCRPD